MEIKNKTREELVIEEVEAKYEEESSRLILTEEEKAINKFVERISPITSIFFTEMVEYLNREVAQQLNKDSFDKNNFNKNNYNNVNFSKTAEEIGRTISKILTMKF